MEQDKVDEKGAGGESVSNRLLDRRTSPKRGAKNDAKDTTLSDIAHTIIKGAGHDPHTIKNMTLANRIVMALTQFEKEAMRVERARILRLISNFQVLLPEDTSAFKQLTILRERIVEGAHE